MKQGVDPNLLNPDTLDAYQMAIGRDPTHGLHFPVAYNLHMLMQEQGEVTDRLMDLVNLDTRLVTDMHEFLDNPQNYNMHTGRMAMTKRNLYHQMEKTHQSLQTKIKYLEKEREFMAEHTQNEQGREVMRHLMAPEQGMRGGRRMD
jgi:hypothetical protein